MSELALSQNVSSIAKEDIEELNNKIQGFKNGTEDEEKFRSFRLSRGVYGQRQEGVQMIRIKIPYGRLNAEQFIRIADIADKYATNKMHCTTRQDLQIHYVKLEDSPKVWAELEDVGVTLKEACGNTVRNVTASAVAGIDPNEPFDVTPYAHEFFEYFLRNPICQEMGRKFKVSFSASEADSAYSFMHDLGFIATTKDGENGFRLVVAGGLGSQPMLAYDAFDFIAIDKIIPFAEAVIRVFDKYGERASRGKARMKFLIKKIGIEKFMELVDLELTTSVINKVYPISDVIELPTPPTKIFPTATPVDEKLFQEWRETNVFEQKQKGYFGVHLKMTHGNIYNDKVRAVAQLMKDGYASDDIRVTVNQGFLLKFVKEENIVSLFNELHKLDLVNPGFDSTADITACPGTDTCNLGIASSYGISTELERLINTEFRELIYNNDIKIKISGCMNACGQHSIANIGFQGMSIKKGAIVMPALQILLGGGFDKEGNATIADKVVKVPAKVAPDAFRALINNYNENKTEGEYYNNYYQRQVAGDKLYFFTLLKPFTVLPDEIPTDFLTDWGDKEQYVKEVGIGECAGVVLDLVGTMIQDADDKLAKATRSITANWQDSIYQSYTAFVAGAKALLIGEDVKCNTQIAILNDFDENFVNKGLASFGGKSFTDVALQINKNEPSLEFAQAYYAEAKAFLTQVQEVRKAQVARMEAAEA